MAKKEQGGPVMINVRVRYLGKKGDPRPTKLAIIDALEQLLKTGEMPDRWQFMFVDWKNPEKTGTGWRGGWRYGGGDSGGGADDLESFRKVILKAIEDMDPDISARKQGEARFSQVRR